MSTPKENLSPHDMADYFETNRLVGTPSRGVKALITMATVSPEQKQSIAARLTLVLAIAGSITIAWANPPSPDRKPGAREQYGDPAEYEIRDRAVTVADEKILLRAAELLADESVWNRNDDRRCDDDEAAGKRSLFCALQAASVEVLRSYDHRRVALQEVRFAIEEATRGQEFEHRLRDFNNQPQTSLEDVKAVLTTALGRVKARLSASEK